MTLNDLKIGQSGIITAVGGEGALRLRLLDMGLIPKTRVRVQKVAPMGDPIQIQVAVRTDHPPGGCPAD
ncbi:MAG: FeoA family protein [Oscillospiraceae bacterium]